MKANTKDTPNNKKVIFGTIRMYGSGYTRVSCKPQPPLRKQILTKPKEKT